jgi:2-polyprenyl-3-methyl-5-hydroxy-6-metoxy-1,4-benzoquinol methylase
MAKTSAPPRPSAIAEIYKDKPSGYFGSSRPDIVELLETGPQSAILELGCGAGGTGRMAMAAGKAARYVGIELDEGAAAIASQHLTEVLVGDVGDTERIDLRPLEGKFDALIISEVLEHLTDPWTTLARLVRCLKPGGVIFASSPNIAHWKVLRELWLGRFVYAEVGVMDKTHLRWFTPDSYREMFDKAGVDVISVAALSRGGWKARAFDRLTGGRFRHLFMAQIMIKGRCRP